MMLLDCSFLKKKKKNKLSNSQSKKNTNHSDQLSDLIMKLNNSIPYDWAERSQAPKHQTKV